MVYEGRSLCRVEMDALFVTPLRLYSLDDLVRTLEIAEFMLSESNGEKSQASFKSSVKGNSIVLVGSNAVVEPVSNHELKGLRR